MSEENKTTGPAVSVLMSCYNGSRWLPEAVESVLSQTLEDFELLLVDDGSRDNTLEIIRGYAARDTRIKVLAKPNTGLADSLNAGLALAKGAWVARVDQDDICGPDRLRKQLSYALGHPGVVLVGSGFAEINEAGEVLKAHRYPAGHSALVSRLERLQGFFPHSSAFYKAEAARRVGGYNKRITRAEDWRLWLDLSSAGGLACLPDLLVKIRKHPGQMSWDGSGSRQLFDAAAATAGYLLGKAGLPDPAAVSDEAEWTAFLSWAEQRMAFYQVLEQRKAWWEARAAFVSAGGGPSGLLHFAARLLRSGRALELLKVKLFGSDLPRRLAAEWAAESGRTAG